MSPIRSLPAHRSGMQFYAVFDFCKFQRRAKNAVFDVAYIFLQFRFGIAQTDITVESGTG